ncbi:MAG: carboxypeptidase regulatory-like domain-containing protein, partial [Maribacter sp.]|nr:carboxypeptidase regulatory-like domain-containing protein [Maribacter sp.]
TDGTTFDLTVPSGEQTGIKVFIKPGLVVEGGLTADLLLDFDVSKSFVPKGNINDFAGITGFNFKPVIKASNKSTAGTLSGVVTTIQEEAAIGLEGAQIAVFAADTLNTTTFTDETGAYMVLGLDAGSYDVEVELEGYEMQTGEGIEIIAANKTIQDFELVAIP